MIRELVDLLKGDLQLAGLLKKVGENNLPSHRSPRIAASPSSTVHSSSLHISDLPCNQSPYIDHKNFSFFPLAAIDHLPAGGNLRHPSWNMSFSISVVAIAGILFTAAFLFTYSVLVFKCCLKRRTPDILIHFFSTARGDISQASTTSEPTGLDSAAIRSIPTFCYTSIQSSAAAECAVCLSDFRSGEHLRLLPECCHAFHIDCIDAWLQTKTSCPICRSHITNPCPPPTDNRIVPNQSVVVEVREEGIRNQRRRLGQAVSMGNEFIEVRTEKDEVFAVQSLRR
ncbi:RING-H2 finger protein ATL16-like, partial [Phalaenopsis equestris]|uniref:RING-H2 finger protein ATL16-like n=1 Tax=Phalaenopsis equestris TaxID=78828 RepID=UPI0009E54DC0